MDVSSNLPICSTLSFPRHVYMSLLYACISIPALQIVSSVSFFWIPHVCVNIQYFFSDISLCMVDSRSIHISTNDWILFLFMAQKYWDMDLTGSSVLWFRICLPTQETCVSFLGWEDPLEKEMATHSSILVWRIPWTGGLQSLGSKRVRHDLVTEQQQYWDIIDISTKHI